MLFQPSLVPHDAQRPELGIAHRLGLQDRVHLPDAGGSKDLLFLFVPHADPGSPRVLSVSDHALFQSINFGELA